MKRVKMPLTFKMYTFLITRTDILWVSQSKSMLQKFVELFKNNVKSYCNTVYNKLTINSPFIRNVNDVLVHDSPFNAQTYNITSHNKERVIESKLPDLFRIREFDPTKELKALCYDPIEEEYTLAVLSDNDSIFIYDILSGMIVSEFYYHSYKKWYWSKWDVAGLQYSRSKDLFLGLSVKTKFGFYLNYLKIIKS